jgi:hypothetical protein
VQREMQSWRLREAVHRKTRRHDLVFRICIVETAVRNKKISKVPRVGEIVLFAYSLLCFVVCVAFALLLATGHIEDSSLGSNEAQRVDESERTCSESRRAKGYRYRLRRFSSKIHGYLLRRLPLVSFFKTLARSRNVLPTHRACALRMSFCSK